MTPKNRKRKPPSGIWNLDGGFEEEIFGAYQEVLAESNVHCHSEDMLGFVPEDDDGYPVFMFENEHIYNLLLGGINVSQRICRYLLTEDETGDQFEVLSIEILLEEADYTIGFGLPPMPRNELLMTALLEHETIRVVFGDGEGEAWCIEVDMLNSHEDIQHLLDDFIKVVPVFVQEAITEQEEDLLEDVYEGT